MQKINQENKGSATVELLIAFAILILNITAVILLINGGQSISIDTQTNTEAIKKAETMLVDAKIQAKTNFSGIASIPNVNDDIYKKDLLVEPVAGDDSTKKVTATVNWKAEGGRDLFIKLTSLITNPFTGICSSELKDPDAWKYPQIYPPGSPPGFPTTELVKQSPLNTNANGLEISDLKAYKNKLYITAKSTAGGTDTHTLWIANLPTDPNQNPTFSGWVATNIGKSLSALTIAPYNNGKKLYVYVANAFTPSYSSCLTGGIPDKAKCAQLQVIDVTPGITPALVSNANSMIVAKTSGTNPALAGGNSIFYYKGYIYLGLTPASGGGSEFNIFDIGGGSGSPTNPIPKGTLSTGGRAISSIFVKNTFAYITTTDNSNGKGLMVIDISNPSSPTPKWSNIFSSSFGYANAIASSVDPLYIGMTYNSTNPELYLLKNSNPDLSSPTFLGSGRDIGGNQGVSGIIVRPPLAFIISRSASQVGQFQVWNIADPNNIFPWTPNNNINEFINFDSVGANGSGEATSCTGNYIYLSAAFKDVGNNFKDVIAIIGPALLPQTITFNPNPLPNKTLGDPDFTVTATSSSGLPVSFSSLNTAVCTISTNTVHLVSSGTCTIRASQSGDSTYNPAPNIDRPFTVSSPTTFNYTLTAPTINMSKNSSAPVTITVTKTAGIAETVNVSLSSLPSGVNYLPLSLSCPPTSGTCPVTFTLTSGNGKVNNKTIIINGISAPSGITATGSFNINVN